MNSYFHLQYWRLQRLFQEIGINHILGLILGSVLFVGISLLFFHKISWANYGYPLIALFSLTNLNGSKRIRFLKLNFSENQVMKIRLLENFILITPFLLFMLFKAHIIGAQVLTICALGLSFFNNSANNNFIIPTPFGRRPFEFLHGFRKSILGLIAVHIIAVIAFQVENFNLLVFCLLLINFISISFIFIQEPMAYVSMHKRGSIQFLIYKILTAYRHHILLNIPILIIVAIGFSNQISYSILVVLLGLIYLTYVFFLKFAYYPNEVQLVPGLLFAISLLFPPLIIILGPVYYLKARKKLELILEC